MSGEATPKPMRRARVTLTGATLLGSRVLYTDDTGRFTFVNVPAGSFGLTATKAPYLATAYGARRPGGGGTTIRLDDGQRFTDVVLTLVRGAVISGVVRDERGDPAPGVSIQAIYLQNRLGGGPDVRITSGNATTDDRGMYRIFGLPPRAYYIQAEPRALTSTTNALLTRQEDLDAAAAALRGAGPSSPRGASGSPARRPSVMLVGVLYPGVTSPADAQLVTVGIGEERPGVDLALKLVPAARVEGVVSNPGGPLPANVDVRLTATTREGSSSSLFSALPMRPGQDGSFSFAGIAPGQYVATAVTSASGRGANASAAVSLWAAAEVSVNGADVSGVSLSLQPGMSVSGRLTVDAATAPAPADLSVFRLSLQPILTGSQVAISSGAQPVAADGGFTIRGVLPGRYRLSVLPPPPSQGGTAWTVRSAMLGGAEVYDLPFEVRGGDNFSGIAVTMTDRTTELSGMLQDASGKPAPEYVLVVFAENRELWNTLTRGVTQTRPATDGRFVVRNLRPGNYLMAAVTDLEPGAISDSDFLEGLIAGAIKITLAEGDKKVQDVKIGR
jgi:hypothetical protein